MPRPNPPRKRPRRRPDAVERSTRAEVALTRQTAQVNEKNGSSGAKQQSSAKLAAKAKPPLKGAAGRAQRLNEPYVPWAKRSYAILVALMAAGELIIGGLTYFTYSGSKPPLATFLLGVDAGSLGPIIAVAAALVAAQFAKYITKESRSLRFMESAMAGVIQYFIFFALFIGLLYLLGLGSSASATKGLTINEPLELAGLALVDIASFVGTYFIYPPLYRRMRVKSPPPRTPRPAKDKAATEPPAPKGSKTMVDKMDEATTTNQEAKDTTA
jgi:hypothetical protein